MSSQDLTFGTSQQGHKKASEPKKICENQPHAYSWYRMYADTFGSSFVLDLKKLINTPTTTATFSSILGREKKKKELQRLGQCGHKRLWRKIFAADALVAGLLLEAFKQIADLLQGSLCSVLCLHFTWFYSQHKSF